MKANVILKLHPLINRLKLADCLSLKDAVFSIDGRIRYFGFMETDRG